MRPLLLALALVACSRSAPPPGTATEIPQVCAGADGSRVRLSGTLRYRRGLMSFCSSFGGHKTCDMALYATADRPADFDIMAKPSGPEPVHARLSVPVGSGPGEMDQPPKQFTEADIKLHLPDGKTATDGTPVTIDGKLSVIPGDPAKPDAPKQCYVTVEWATSP